VNVIWLYAVLCDTVNGKKNLRLDARRMAKTLHYLDLGLPAMLREPTYQASLE